jgi:hypothetical protein
VSLCVIGEWIFAEGILLAGGPAGVVSYWVAERMQDLPRRKKGKEHSHIERLFVQSLT